MIGPPEEIALPSRASGELNLGDLPKLSPEEAQLLSRHFEVFTETTNRLVAAHQHLQRQVCSLMEELEAKNRELEGVNQALARKILETEEVREFLDRVIDSMQSGLAAFDPDGNLTRINRSAREILGWVDDTPARFEDLVGSGDARPPLRVPLADGQPRSGEMRLRGRDGRSVLARFTAVPLTPGAEGEPGDCGTLLAFEDLSRLRLLEEKVRRSGRLAALGELAAGVAHEMRNPLATMRGFLQLLPTEFEDPEFREECSTRLIREIDRLARLTDSLLELSRPIRVEGVAVDLRELVEEVLAEQKEALRAEGIEVSREFKETPPPQLDRDRIKQVLLNLVLNARQAISGEGRIHVRLGTRREAWGADERETLLAFLTVQDNGRGIEAGHLESIFDPFFTTKDGGTGLGLALCHRIVEEHGGAIRVESEVGRGSAFTLYFPLEPRGD